MVPGACSRWVGSPSSAGRSSSRSSLGWSTSSHARRTERTRGRGRRCTPRERRAVEPGLDRRVQRRALRLRRRHAGVLLPPGLSSVPRVEDLERDRVRWAPRARPLGRGARDCRRPGAVGQLYEYSSLLSLLVVAGYLIVVEGIYKLRTLGGFALAFSVLTMAVAVEFLYVGPGPLVPALNSYWIKIHVVAAFAGSSLFALGS